MKYFVLWIAILFCVTVCFPLSFLLLNSILKSDTTKEKKSEINVYFAQEGKTKVMDTEEYVLGVLMAEMPASFEVEALKAQSVAARTYLYEKMYTKSAKEVHKGGDICTDPAHCQAFVSESDAKRKWGENARFYFEKCKKAVEMTSGIIAQYENKPIKAVFHAFASGRTEDAKDVWGGDVEYLKSVESPGDLSAPGFSDLYTVEVNEFKRIMTNNFGCSFNENFLGNITYTKGGSVDTVQVGDKIVKGTKIREALGLRSSCFSIKEESDLLTFEVKGYGHGVGMSQYGANYFAKQGMKYDKILKKYYTGIELVNMNCEVE